MKRIYTGILLSLIGGFLILFDTQVTTLLLGGPPKMKKSVWVQDRQVVANVNDVVLWSGGTLFVAGLTILAVLAAQTAKRRMHRQKTAP
jgi:hypothetical protein